MTVHRLLLPRKAEQMIKDSGRRIQMAGMQRDVTDGKIKYHLVFDGPMFERWAAHLTEGAKKYGERNWQDARTVEERDRFKESAVRHFIQWLRGDTDEDHAAAILFNVNGFEYVQSVLEKDEARVQLYGVQYATPEQQVSLSLTQAAQKVELKVPLAEREHFRSNVIDRRVCNTYTSRTPARRLGSPRGRRRSDFTNYAVLPVCKKKNKK